MNEAKYTAYPADGKEILKILESSAAKGNIELLYTRRPDAYESYMKESGESRVFVSKKGGCIIGTCAEIIREVYIGGEIRKAAYICGLKKDTDVTGNIGFGVNFIKGLCRDDIDYYYCSVLSDNTDVQRMFEKSRRIISMAPISEYKTYILNPKVKIRTPANTLTFRKATKEDIPHLIEFLNSEGKKKDLFPVFKSLDQFHNLSYEDFYLLTDKGGIVATAALWNQTEYKQYIVKKYRRFMKFARILNPLISLLGYIRLPRENCTLNFPTLSFFISKNNNKDYYRILLNSIKKEIAKKYSIFVIGLPKEHAATLLFEKLPNINFKTILYEIRFPRNNQDCQKLDIENIHPECGLL